MIERVAEQFRALAEPSRVQLLNLLFDAERTVGDLAAASGLSLANVSKHLGLLHRARWVDRRKSGLQVVYSLADERAFALCKIVCDRIGERASAEPSRRNGSRRAH